MRLRSNLRTLSLASILAAAMAATPVSAAAAEYFDGAGYGPTADYAVQAAIWDAEASANALGFYTCDMVGEPEVFPGAPGDRRAFRAQVTLRCTM